MISWIYINPAIYEDKKKLFPYLLLSCKKDKQWLTTQFLRQFGLHTQLVNFCDLYSIKWTLTSQSPTLTLDMN